MAQEHYLYIYIYICMRERERERELKNKVIQREFNVKESQHNNILVLMNHHQVFEGLYQTMLNQRWIFNEIQNNTEKEVAIF